jgi:hypothetical protein
VTVAPGGAAFDSRDICGCPGAAATDAVTTATAVRALTTAAVSLTDLRRQGFVTAS